MRTFGYYFCAGIALVVGLGLAVCGVGFVAAGADAAHLSRPLIGAGMCVVGLGGIVAGARMATHPFRSPRPEMLALRIVNLARAVGGELTLARVVRSLRISEEHARAGLDRLIGDGLCVPEQRGAEEWYVFPWRNE